MVIAGGDDLLALGKNATVEFAARRLSRPQVVWLNKRWFASTMDIDWNSIEFDSIQRWLISSFAFVVKEDEYPDEMFFREDKIFHADRYGDDGYTPHGGSGRVGTLGNFQVKGIGRTPLVGQDADWLHRNGCVWLEEAVREAVVSEVLRGELPLGAVPVIAIIDTGLSGGPSDTPDSRRVLIVRPSSFRPAHLQRAPLFRPSHGFGSDFHAGDSARCISATEQLAPHPDRLEGWLAYAAQQLAYAHVHRIYLGGMLPSNWSVRGEIADVGSISFLGTWDFGFSVPGLPLFGSEKHAIEEFVKSVHRRASRFFPAWKCTSARDLISSFRSTYERRLRQCSSRLLGDTGHRFADAFLSGSGTPIDGFAPCQLLPRPQLERNWLRNRIQEQYKNKRGNPGWAAGIVCALQTSARRDWPTLPPDANVVAQYVGEQCSLVIYRRGRELWLLAEEARRKKLSHQYLARSRGLESDFDLAVEQLSRDLDDIFKVPDARAHDAWFVPPA